MLKKAWEWTELRGQVICRSRGIEDLMTGKREGMGDLLAERVAEVVKMEVLRFFQRGEG
jgi:hypothetical protein